MQAMRCLQPPRAWLSLTFIAEPWAWILFKHLLRCDFLAGHCLLAPMTKRCHLSNTYSRSSMMLLRSLILLHKVCTIEWGVPQFEEGREETRLGSHATELSWSCLNWSCYWGTEIFVRYKSCVVFFVPALLGFGERIARGCWAPLSPSTRAISIFTSCCGKSEAEHLLDMYVYSSSTTTRVVAE
mgnify:CR=1 FL=1